MFLLIDHTMPAGLYMDHLSPADYGAVSIFDGSGREGQNVQLRIDPHDHLFPLPLNRLLVKPWHFIFVQFQIAMTGVPPGILIAKTTWW